MPCRFYPECNISDDISTEADRVKFLQSIAQVTLTKARMKLNLKRLYAADGAAVKELLKLAELLYKATQTANSTEEVRCMLQATAACFRQQHGTCLALVICWRHRMARVVHNSGNAPSLKDGSGYH